MTRLPKATLKRIMREAGVIRVSEKGLEAYREAIETYAFGLADMSLKCANHAKRKTVVDADIRLAVE